MRITTCSGLFYLAVMIRWRSLWPIAECNGPLAQPAGNCWVQKTQETVRRILAFRSLFTEFANPQFADIVFCTAYIACAFCKYFTFL